MRTGVINTPTDHSHIRALPFYNLAQPGSDEDVEPSAPLGMSKSSSLTFPGSLMCNLLIFLTQVTLLYWVNAPIIVFMRRPVLSTRLRYHYIEVARLNACAG